MALSGTLTQPLLCSIVTNCLRVSPRIRKFQRVRVSSSWIHSSGGPFLNSNEVRVLFSNGDHMLEIPLQSKTENCLFTVNPYLHTISDLQSSLTAEDGGIEKVAVYSPDGQRFAQSTPVRVLLRLPNFTLHINDKSYSVTPPASATANDSGDADAEINEAKELVARLFSSLHIADYQKQQEAFLLSRLASLEEELKPLEEKKTQLDANVAQKVSRMKMYGLAGTFLLCLVMGVQMGIFARLTWWEYSWDIMEPVTYFATYSALVMFYMYYVCTNQSYEYETAFSRQALHGLHKTAKKANFNVNEYNRIKAAVYQIEHDLKRLRDPLMPSSQLFDTKHNSHDS